jgi:PAS domain S-box-containing protein
MKNISTLNESIQQYLTILSSLNDALHVVDKELRILFQNPAMIQWLEELNLNSDINGKTIFEAFPFLDYEKVYSEYDKVFKNRELLTTTETTNLLDRTVFNETLKIPIISNGEVSHIITILRNITDQREVEEKLKTSEEKYKNIISNLMDIIIILDLKGNFQYVSPQIYNISGFQPEEIIGKNGFKLMHPDDIKNAAVILKEAMAKKKRVYIEYRTIHKDGYYINVSASGKIVQIDGEDRIFAVVRDITEQKRSELKLKESEEKYRLITENANDMIAILNKKIEYEYVNEAAFQNVMGRTKDILIGGSALRWVHPDDVNKCLNAFKEGWEDGESNIQARFKDENDEYRWLDIKGKTITDEKGEKKVLIISRDISKRKEYEERLKLSEEKYRYLIENALEGVWVIDLKADTILVNPSMANILGYSVEEMIGKSVLLFMDENQAKITKMHLEKRKEGIAEERDAVFFHKNGNKVYLRIRATPIFDKQGNYEGTYAFLADITQRKLAKQLLKESEEKFRAIFESIPIGMHLYEAKQNNQLIFIGANPTADDILHVDNTQFINKTIEEAFPPLINTDIPDRYKKIANEGGIWKWDQVDYKDEKIRGAYEVVAFQTTPGFMVTSFNDITKRIEAENKIKESEEEYRLISENTDDLIVVYSEDGIVEYFNAVTHSRVLGHSVDKLKNKSFRDALVHEEDREIGAKSVSEGLEKGSYYYQFRLRHQKGNYIWFEVTGKKFKDNYDNTKILCVSRNIDEKKSAEQKIKESEENFRTIAEQAFSGTLIIQDDKVEYVNNALLQIFEYTPDEVDNWNKDDLIKLIYPEDLQYLREYRERLRSGESDIKQYYSYRVFTKYGKVKWIDQFSRPIIYRGKIAELITIMDITEKKKAEQELIKLNNLKSELLRRTSHELKTPLVSIKGFSELLLTVHKEKLDDYVLATIHEIKLGCERLESLIQDILKTSELDSDSVELKKSEEDVSFLIKLCVKELQGLIRLRGHEINLDIHDKLIARIEPDQIHLVISNLLNNAIKYTPPHGKIDIRSAITDDIILISIHDNGIGLTNEEKKRLFSQFGKIERYGQGLDIISDGSGLGLFITKKIVELHGGKIWVRSKGRNKGSSFYFSLPLIIKE